MFILPSGNCFEGRHGNNKEESKREVEKEGWEVRRENVL